MRTNPKSPMWTENAAAFYTMGYSVETACKLADRIEREAKFARECEQDTQHALAMGEMFFGSPQGDGSGGSKPGDAVEWSARSKQPKSLMPLRPTPNSPDGEAA